MYYTYFYVILGVSVFDFAAPKIGRFMRATSQNVPIVETTQFVRFIIDIMCVKCYG